ncbi:ribonuclease P protein component [Chlamydia sp. 12-01]|uniref:ribonuclease P protein component n=1 Tax=Chlamydia sp. 12-01 TaxID=3002742 RepID=UPI0035D43AF4
MQRSTLPKYARVLKRKQFLYISRSGSHCQGSQVIFHVAPSKYSGCCKLGITVSKKFGKAHKRNYFKRIVREAFRQQRHSLPACQIVVMPKNKQQPKFEELLQDFTQQVPEALNSKLAKNKPTTGVECSPKNEKCETALP